MATDDKNLVPRMIEIDLHELACRIIEAATNSDRPPGMSGYDAMMALNEDDLRSAAEVMAAARAAITYFTECLAESLNGDGLPAPRLISPAEQSAGTETKQ